MQGFWCNHLRLETKNTGKLSKWSKSCTKTTVLGMKWRKIAQKQAKMRQKRLRSIVLYVLNFPPYSLTTLFVFLKTSILTSRYTSAHPIHSASSYSSLHLAFSNSYPLLVILLHIDKILITILPINPARFVKNDILHCIRRNRRESISIHLDNSPSFVLYCLFVYASLTPVIDDVL